jgi:hypothetical protein
LAAELTKLSRVLLLLPRTANSAGRSLKLLLVALASLAVSSPSVPSF